MLQSAFKTMAAFSALQKYKDLAERGADADAVRYFLAVESWLEDNVSFPGGLYRACIRECYKQNRLVQCTPEVGGVRVDLVTLRMPLLNVIAKRDTICEPSSSMALT